MKQEISEPSTDSKEFQEGELAAERHNNIWRTENYVLPAIEKLFDQSKDKKNVKILSVGCGNGEDVDTLIEHGYNAFGVDTGYRSQEWKHRKHPGAFRVADGKELPYQDGEFDLILNFGVIEHIGAVGDTTELLPDFEEHRRKFAQELARVTKKDGHLLLTTPNKSFPMDMWHGPFVFGARFHSPFENFLVSFGDIKKFFVMSGHWSDVQSLGLKNFFQFKKTGRELWIRLLLPAIKAALSVISNFHFLRASFLNPFLIVLLRK